MIMRIAKIDSLFTFEIFVFLPCPIVGVWTATRLGRIANGLSVCLYERVEWAVRRRVRVQTVLFANLGRAIGRGMGRWILMGGIGDRRSNMLG